MSQHNISRSKHRRRGNRRPDKPEIDFPLCPLCQKAVRDLASAITHKESGAPAHFDCILKTLRGVHAVQQNEKICYLGKGSFGIVQFRQNPGPMRFLIRKRIQYEDTEPVPEWRQKPHTSI
jgi:hypothetical protein